MLSKSRWMTNNSKTNQLFSVYVNHFSMKKTPQKNQGIKDTVLENLGGWSTQTSWSFDFLSRRRSDNQVILAL